MSSPLEAPCPILPLYVATEHQAEHPVPCGGSHQLSILHVVVCTYRCCSRSVSLLGICRVSRSGMSDFVIPWTVAHLLCPWNAPARILEWVGMPFSRGIFLTQGSKPDLLQCRQTLYHQSYQVSPACPNLSFLGVAPCDIVPPPHKVTSLHHLAATVFSLPLQPTVSCGCWLSVTLYVCFHVLPNPNL